MDPHHLALPVGFQIEHFRIEAVLGKGGFGITYLAVDLQLGKRVAIKELLPDTIATRVEGLTVVPHSHGMQENWEWARERFLEEARILATFSHPAIVGVHRLIEANGTVYMVMDYVEGESYEARLQRIGTEPDQASLMAVIGPILSGLEEVHAHGLLHRDIKPENILIDKRGQPILIDFGSARESVGKTMTMTSIVTHGYSPIEQYQTKGRMGPWTDIYALAAVMCRAIAGQKPPEAPDRIVEDEFVWLSYRDLPGFSATFSQSVDWALRVRPEERPQLVGDFVQQLTQSDETATAVAAEQSELPPEPEDYREEKATPNAAVPPDYIPAVVPKRNRWSVPILAATAVVLLLVSAGAYMVASERSKRLAAEQAAAEEAQEMLRREEQAAKEEQEKQEEAQRLALAQKQSEEKAAADLAQKELEAKRKAKPQAKDAGSVKNPASSTLKAPSAAPSHTFKTQRSGTSAALLPGLPDPIAMVEGEPLSLRDLEDTYLNALESSGINGDDLSTDQKMAGYREILDELIIDRLLSREAARVDVNDAELEEEISRVKSQFPSEDNFKEEMAKAGETNASFRDTVRKMMQQQKWMELQTGSNIRVTDNDVRQFYDKNRKEFEHPAMVRASHILINVPEGATDEVVAEKKLVAEKALQRASRGEDFVSVAKEVSEEPGASDSGGDLNFFPKDRMVPEFANAAFAMRSGEISTRPIRTKFGWHVIKVTDRKQAGTMAFTEVKDQVREYLEGGKRRDAVKSVIDRIRADANVVSKFPKDP